MEQGAVHSSRFGNEAVLSRKRLNPLEKPIDWKGVQRWASKGFFAILDQGIFAGTNFIANILLARWLTPEGYGAFTVVYSIFWLALTAYTALLIEPMMVFGAGRYSKDFRRYLGLLSYGHILVSGGLFLILSMGSLMLRLFGETQVSEALFAVALTSPFILLLWLFRRAFYVKLKPSFASAGGVLYMMVFLSSIIFLRYTTGLSPIKTFLCMGGASALASIMLIAMLRPEFKNNNKDDFGLIVAGDHWVYGRWSLGNAAVMWIPGNIYYSILPFWIGLYGAAALRALMNLLMPFLHSLIALGGLLVPMLSKRIAVGRKKEAEFILKRAIVLFLAFALGFWLVLVLWGREFMLLLYGGRYLEVAGLIKVAGILLLSASCVAIMEAALRATESPKMVFWGRLFGLTITISVGLPLAKSQGIFGALIGIIGASLASAIVMSYFVAKAKKT